MGVYIKGMKIPKSCWRCYIPLGTLKCPVQTEEEAMRYCSCRHKDCPIVPIPPHGDLIDREALMDDIIGSMVFSGRNVPKEAAIVQKVLDIVGDANAILEAEEDE